MQMALHATDAFSILRGTDAVSEWPQNRKRNHPRHREMDTSRIDKVKAPQHVKTRRSHIFGVKSGFSM